MNDLIPMIVTGIVFFSFIAIVKIISDNRLRNRLVDKGMVDENVKYLFYRSTSMQPITSLKWGLILVAIGIALFLVQILPEAFEEEGALGLVFVLTGVALFIHYFIILRQSRREQTE